MGALARVLMEVVEETGRLPLSWAGSTSRMDYLNFGDALSPVMVALCSGYAVERVKFRSPLPRLAAVGTIGQNLERGEVWFWGTGTSKLKNPSGPVELRQPYVTPADTEIHIAATRGPVSARILSGTGPLQGNGVHGDPVWVLPRFYRPQVEKKYEVGAILHLSEVVSRDGSVDYPPDYRRYDVPPSHRDAIHLINTITPISLDGLKSKIDEILSCKRIVSTSLHGMVIAESYGIPCLYFSPHAHRPGAVTIDLDPNSDLDLRIVDLYRGLGLERLTVYGQPRRMTTDWDDVIRAIDREWEPRTLDEAALMAAFPLPARPLRVPDKGTIWDHPALAGLTFSHAVSDIARREKERLAELARRNRIAARKLASRTLGAERG